MDALHLALTAGRPWDLVLDVAAGRARRGAGRCCSTTSAAAAGSPSALPGRSGRRHDVRRAGPRGPGSRASRAADARPRPARQPRAGPRRAGRLGRGPADRGRLAASRPARSATLAKVPEEDADAFLRARPEAGRVLDDGPGLRFTSRCVLRVQRAGRTCRPRSTPRRCRCASTTTSPASAARRRTAPGWCCRRATGTRSSGGCATWPSPSGRRASCASPSRPTARLEGAHFLLDSYVRGHFGHALTDQVGHFWGWRGGPGAASRPAGPGVRQARARAWPTWELDLLAAGGVDADRVVVAHEPTAVETLVDGRRRCSGCRPTCTRRSRRRTPRSGTRLAAAPAG